MSKEDKTENMNFKISLRELRGKISSVPDFTEGELREALKICEQNGVPCPTTSPLHFLNISASIKLLHILNLFLKTGDIPEV